MRRADRLLQIVQILRRRRRPTTADSLAAELEVSARTVYRDMDALLAGGVPIAGEAGIGYVLRAGYDLPPLMFTIEEIEAVVLGAQMVAKTGDRMLARAAEDAVAKIAHVLPGALREELERTALFAPDVGCKAPIDLAPVRAAVRRERKLKIAYRDGAERATERRIWPLLVAFLGEAALVGAWCELRRDFRTFRADRIAAIEPLEERFDGRRGALRREYLAAIDMMD
ncbi:MAG: YafY family transcriptional regulator [Alphaproteobacteria bacterium]|nr:YafY family transcriptional regulator [Alphaproteobacteria bacterium]